MIIECDQCNTRFIVKNSEIGEYGRMVSCSVCKYEWLYVPTSISSKKKPYLMVVMILLMSITVSFFYLEREYIYTKSSIFKQAYNLLGYKKKQNVIIKHLSVKSDDAYYIHLIAYNNSQKNQNVKRVIVKGLDINSKQIFHKSYHINITIKPDKEAPIILKDNIEKNIKYFSVILEYTP